MRDSAWRQNQLVILCYHGVSLHNEHEWDSELFMSPERFRERLVFLRDQHYNVLPLGEALDRLGQRTLPPRSVVLTFDDGFYDFSAVAAPLLEEFGFPATVYLTTYYCYARQPIFQLMASYLFWHARQRQLAAFPEFGWTAPVDLGKPSARVALVMQLKQLEERENWTPDDRERALRRLASACGDAPYEEFVARRILQIMTPAEATAISQRGFDVQLHTHRHRTPFQEGLFRREIQDNARAIQELTGARPSHFCYPSGVYQPAFFPWLETEGVESATTCKPGIATPSAYRLELPRYVDTMLQSTADFASWVSGMAALLR